jgi:hypothetical protein
MPYPFRFTNRSSVAHPEGGSGRTFSFRHLSIRRGNDNNNNKRPLADWSCDASMAMEEDEYNSWYDFTANSQTGAPEESSMAQTPLMSSRYRKVGSPSAADKKNRLKRRKMPIVEGGGGSPSRDAIEATPTQHPLFTPAKDKPLSSCLPNSFSKPVRSSSDHFQSILDHPFEYWQQVNVILKEVCPAWTSYQRGRIIHHLIHFLELKIGKDEYVPTGLLLPTPVVELAWRALVMETSLYVKITHALQDFHQKPRSIIHCTLVSNRDLSHYKVEDKIRRTQSLFLVYFKEIMPSTIEDEPREPLSSPPPHTRPKASTTLFRFPRDKSMGDTISELPSLSCIIEQKRHVVSSPFVEKQYISSSSPREDWTVATTATSSSETTDCLVGLDLLNDP